MNTKSATKVLIWDFPTRAFHWLLAISFFGAYVLAESERVRHFHVMFGYTVMALVLFRLLWGFVGSPYARFKSFAFGPKAVARHLAGIAQRDVPEFTGHTPAGSWAIWAMLLLALLTAGSGYLNFNDVGGEAMEELHEIAANVWLLVVFIHVAGVIVGSIAERQNLIRSMITGYKQLASVPRAVRNFAFAGMLIMLAIGGFWTATVATNGGVVMPGQAELTMEERPHLSADLHSDDDD